MSDTEVKELTEKLDERSIEDENKTDVDVENIKNRGTGAGGSNTNRNGLSYEELTEIKENSRYKVIDNIKLDKKVIQVIDIDGQQFIKLTKNDLKKYMIKNNEYNVNKKSLQPDECYVSEDNKIINIIEKKFQQGPGSCDEKIQTAVFKEWFYKKLYPNYKIKYCYCLSNWFKKDKYEPEIIFLKEKGFEVFWGNDESYINNILDWIINNS
jgi:translation elongation factor P/translation initiation factor 5A